MLNLVILAKKKLFKYTYIVRIIYNQVKNRFYLFLELKVKPLVLCFESETICFYSLRVNLNDQILFPPLEDLGRILAF